MKFATHTERAVLRNLKDGSFTRAVELLQSDFVDKASNSQFHWVGEFLRAKAPDKAIRSMFDTHPDIIHQVDKDGYCSLFYASRLHNKLVLKECIESNFDINKDIAISGKPIIAATQKNGVDFLRFMVRLGADPFATNKQGLNAIAQARRWASYENISFLEALEENPDLVTTIRKQPASDLVTLETSF